MPQDICMTDHTASARPGSRTILLIAALFIAIAALGVIGAGSGGPAKPIATDPAVEDWHGNVMRSHWQR